MLRTLKILCILLKVLMLTRIAIVSTDYITHNQGILDFQFIDVRDYMSSNIESVQNYSEIVTVKNEVALQEGIIPSPEGIPSEPIFPRAFVEFGNRLNKTDIFVTFRWNKPEFTNTTIQKYRVQYWFIENLKKIQTVDIIPVNNTILQHKVYNLKPDTMYYFKVQAHNEVGGGPYTKFIKVLTTHENPVPLLATALRSTRLVTVLDIDLRISFIIITEYISEEIVYSALEHKIYGITDTWELITCDFNFSAMKTERNINCTKIIGLDSPAYNLCIDWVARNLYWIQISNGINNIMKLDLTLWQIDVKYDIFLKTKESKYLTVLPSTGYIYWMELTSDKQYVIMQSDFDGKNIKPFLENEDNKCFCQDKLLDSTSILHIDTTNIDKPLIYWTLKNRLIAADIHGCGCSLVFSTKNQIKFDNLIIDKTNIYLHGEQLIYILKKEYALLENKEDAFKYVQKIYLLFYGNQLTLDKTLQPYPPTICLTSKVMKGYHVEKVSINENSIVVNLPEPVPNDGCEKYNLATTIYTISVSYLTCLDNGLTKLKEFKERTYKRTYKIKNLTPFTEYTLKLALSNFYVDKLSMGLQYDAGVKLTTISGKVNAPEDVMVRVLTPTVAVVYWTPPKKLNCVAVKYEVNWMHLANNTEIQEVIGFRVQFTNQTLVREFIDKPERTLDGKFFKIIQSLLPKQKYNISVSVYPTNYKLFYKSDSLTKIVYMEPNNIILSGVSTDSMNISLISSVNLTIHTGFGYTLEYKNYGMLEWQIANSTEINNDKITFYIKNLFPRTLYKFRLILKYPMIDFISPDEEEFTFETLGNVPSAPGIPTVTRLNFTYHLNWKPAQAYDSQVTLYRLEDLIVANNYKEGNHDKNEHWNLYYNGTDNNWIIRRDMNQKYRFRVQADNAYGFGEWSESSAVVDLTKSVEKSTIQHYLPLILSLVGTLLICNVYYSYRRRKRRKEINLCPTTDIELATLNEIPSVNIQPNDLYALTLQYNTDEFVSTIIKKDQITLSKLLGSGAFGKVYQGTVKDFEGSETTPVAIKMLTNDATLQEKIKFLEEAKLMSDYRHEHVLRLLGICVDTNSPWLILELMEVDLLKYLKKRRTLRPSDPYALRLKDLLVMCEDVARGCCYLEEQRFVHRDLACRNCLISVRNRENPIVKISDFGLARDIYEHDYYRMKEGTPLPIRWMAPESLIEGIFTSQSDVWAFGVVMWEITSLGQQPYAAIHNRRVRDHVCAGNKLLKPLNCPQILYELMLNCWSAVKKRPKFKLCLKNIEILKVDIEDAMLISKIPDISGHIQLQPSEIPGYLQMANLVGITANSTSKRLTANDASNDVIESSI